MPSLIDYIHWLQDAEYNRSAKAIMNGIAQLTKGQGSKLQQSLVALELKAKSLESAKFYSSQVYSTVLADFRADMNAIERALIANADEIAQSGGEVARRSTVAKFFPGTTQDLIEQGINPLDAEVFAYFIGQISDKNLKIVVPPASELVGSYTQSQEFIDYMSKWGSGYADYMDDAVRQGLASGWSPIKTAYYVRNMATNLPMNAASTWTRTLQLNAYRDASARMERENGEFVEKKIRIAALDGRTCSACIALHGTEVPMGVRIDDHYLGRCDAIYVPVGGEMPEFMQAMSTPGERQFVPFQKGTDWFDAQSDAYKKSVLGKGKFELYKQGKFKLEDIVSWRNDPVFGMMPGVKPLWQLEGYKSYAEKLAESQVVDFTDFMQIIRDNNIKGYEDFERYLSKLPKKPHVINLSNNPNTKFDYEIKFRNLTIHATKETLNKAGYSVEGLNKLVHRLPDSVADELLDSMYNLGFVDFSCKQYPRAAATGGWGDIVFYKRGYQESTFIHEIGHNIAQRNHGLFEEAFEKFVRMGENPPTSYAMTNVGEDIAESFALFFTESKRLYNTSPKRFKFLADYFKWEPPTW